MNRRNFLQSVAASSVGALAQPLFAASEFMDIPLKDIEGRGGSLNAYSGKVLLIVNVASDCGYTRQYEGLEKLYQTYKSKGLVVLGFPCNDFGGQEPGTEKDIQQFCKERYNVTFPMFSKIGIRTKTHPLFKALTGPDSAIPGPVLWNFNKFLIGRDGVLKARFDSTEEPEGAQLKSALEKALSSS